MNGALLWLTSLTVIHSGPQTLIRSIISPLPKLPLANSCVTVSDLEPSPDGRDIILVWGHAWQSLA